jgi:hypothetical protein
MSRLPLMSEFGIKENNCKVSESLSNSLFMHCMECCVDSDIIIDDAWNEDGDKTEDVVVVFVKNRFMERDNEPSPKDDTDDEEGDETYGEVDNVWNMTLLL